ncbi:MAG: hypothetical protein FJ095_10670 [Deltaproteobacteria bacterium]|nr:hypothetical protein [Deltaproteobacteria bacterium]
MSLKLPIYGLVGDRPVKAVRTPDGGMEVLAFDWKTGELERDMSYTHTLVHPLDEDVDVVDEAEFERRVHALRVSTEHDVIHLQHHDIHDRVLAYHPADGDFREHERQSLPASTRLWTGFYLTLSGHAVGTYSTAHGPVYFMDAARSWLPQGRTQASVMRSVQPGFNRFELTVEGREVARFDYTAPTFGANPFDPYEDEAMVDFFVWLAGCISTGGIFVAYRVDGEAALWDEPKPPSPPAA